MKRLNATQQGLVQRNAARSRLTTVELAERAFARRYDDPVEMLALANLAVEQAETEGATQADKAFALAHLGNALRVNGRFAEAFAALKKAQAAYGAPNALVLSFRASLHQDRRELAEAQACLAEAAELVTDRASRGKLLLQSTYVIDLAGQHRQAAELARKALDLIDEPEMAATGVQLLALYLTNAGDTADAMAVLHHGAPLLDRLGPMGQLRRAWLLGRLAAACEDYDFALVKLSEARSGFKTEGLLQEVALVSLEVSSTLASQGFFWSARNELEGTKEVLNMLGVGAEATASAVLAEALNAKTREQLVAKLATLRLLISQLPRPA